MKSSEQKRTVFLYCLFLGALFLLILRLYSLSVPKGEVQALNGQYTRRIDVASHDGFIYDRRMRLLSHEGTGKVMLVNPDGILSECSLSDAAELISDACKGSSASEVCTRLSDGIPFTLKVTNAARAGEMSDRNGVFVFDTYEKVHGTALHLLGYKDGDGKGVCGLSKDCDVLLSDTLGAKVYAVYQANAVSQTMSGGEFVVTDDAYSEKCGLVLTIDKKLQQYTDALGKTDIESGTVVVSDVNTGEILAMSSYPVYDVENLGKSLSSDKGEFVNRALSTFTPGSVFKLVVAAAALEKNQSLSDFTYTCSGDIYIGKNKFGCHKRDGHGKENLQSAFANSCNTYFVALGREIGLSAILETARKMGVGRQVFADCVRSAASELPDGKNASETLCANVSFGQGPLLLSPLDFVNILDACATGSIKNLSVVKGVYRDGKLGSEQTVGKTHVLSEQTVVKMRQMMKECVENGTGSVAKSSKGELGGKTATAQTGQYGSDGIEKVHRWFCGIFPVSAPKYAIIVLCDGNCRESSPPAVIFRNLADFMISSGF